MARQAGRLACQTDRHCNHPVFPPRCEHTSTRERERVPDAAAAARSCVYKAIGYAKVGKPGGRSSGGRKRFDVGGNECGILHWPITLWHQIVHYSQASFVPRDSQHSGTKKERSLINLDGVCWACLSGHLTRCSSSSSRLRVSHNNGRQFVYVRFS
jgi:hypothetical protein